MSFPFVEKRFTFIQPDNTPITVVGSGDQRQAKFKSLDGQIIVEDPLTKFYKALSPDGNSPTETSVPTFSKANAQSSEGVFVNGNFSERGLPADNSRWRQRRAEVKSLLLNRVLDVGLAPAPPQRQTVGNFVGLCLLIQFPDVAWSISREDVEEFCNKDGYNGFGNNGSVYNYFLDNSNGKLKYSNIVAPYYMAKHPRGYYTNKLVAQPIRAVELIEEALQYHKAHGFDFTRLTSDSQDYVYALNVFYAGPVVNNWAKGLWPHSYHLNDLFELTVGKFAFDYQITNIGNELTLGTFCHENGHMICDFPDLYDYGNESNGIGSYCLMCTGGNVDEKNPVQVNAYLKFKAGWANQVTIIQPGQSYQASSLINDFFIHRKNASEYFIVENREQSKRDVSIESSGIAIWHIDEFGDNNNEQMSLALHYECSLIQADGKNELEQGLNLGDVNDLFHLPSNTQFGRLSKPSSKWWDGTDSGLELNLVGASNNLISFKTQ